MEGIRVKIEDDSGSRDSEFPAKAEEGPEVVTESKSKSSCSDTSSNKEQACESIPFDGSSLIVAKVIGDGVGTQSSVGGEVK